MLTIARPLANLRVWLSINSFITNDPFLKSSMSLNHRRDRTLSRWRTCRHLTPWLKIRPVMPLVANFQSPWVPIRIVSNDVDKKSKHPTQRGSLAIFPDSNKSSSLDNIPFFKWPTTESRQWQTASSMVGLAYKPTHPRYFLSLPLWQRNINYAKFKSQRGQTWRRRRRLPKKDQGVLWWFLEFDEVKGYIFQSLRAASCRT